MLPMWRTKMRFGEAESFFKAKRKLLHEESLRYLLTIPKNRRKPSEAPCERESEVFQALV